MSLNFNGVGRQIALIEGGPMNKQILYASAEELPDEVPQFKKLTLKKGKFVPIPDKTKNRECRLIAGMSGSGKSHYTREIIKQINKGKKKKKPVYVFSALDSDPTLDKIKPSRVKIGGNLINEPITPEHLKDSITVFDDIDVIKPKYLKDAVYHIMDQCLQIGRHQNIETIATTHRCTGRDLQVALNEAHTITVFPVNWSRQQDYLAKEYMGLNTKQIKKLKKLKSRWVTLMRGYPNVLLTETQAFIARDFGEDEEEKKKGRKKKEEEEKEESEKEE